LQKREFGRFAVPQWGHFFSFGFSSTGLPHWTQNFALGGRFFPQAAHFWKIRS
jgi:hypothetical protein